MLNTDMRIVGDFSLMYVPINAGDVRRISERWQSGLVFSPHGASLYKSGSRVCRADKNHAVFLPEGSAYEIECVEGDMCPLINFACINAPTDLTEAELGDASALLEGFGDAERRYALGGFGSEYSVLEYIYGILSAVCGGGETRKEASTVFSQAAEYISANLSNSEMSNDTIAAALNKSTVAFRTRFKAECGVSPMKYLAKLRMDRAKLLLLEESMSVREVAASVGYSDIYSFSRSFRNNCGCSPLQYRKRKRTKLDKSETEVGE